MTIRFIIALLASTPALLFAKTPEEVFEIASKSVVAIKVLDENDNKLTMIGSGVVVTRNEVITNCHVAEKGRFLLVRHQGLDHAAILTARLRQHDLCLLRVRDLAGQPVVLGVATKLRVGTPVYAIGAPEGLELSLSNGLVSQLRGGEGLPIIQTTAPISPGSSGGGLFDSEGRLVGITTFFLAGGQNLNFAMPVDWLPELRKSENLAFRGQGKPAPLGGERALRPVAVVPGVPGRQPGQSTPGDRTQFNDLGINGSVNPLQEYKIDAIATPQSLQAAPQ
ncbi:MAG TPA: serine protease [Thiobacillaceae bacterium]|nr:serine protease [Thiobacillaceae bacterium]